MTDEEWITCIELANKHGNTGFVYNHLTKTRQILKDGGCDLGVFYKSANSFQQALKYHARRLRLPLVLQKGRPCG